MGVAAWRPEAFDACELEASCLQLGHVGMLLTSLSQERGVGGHGKCRPSLYPAKAPSLGDSGGSPLLWVLWVALWGPWTSPDQERPRNVLEEAGFVCLLWIQGVRIARASVSHLASLLPDRQARILCLDLPLTQALRISLSSVGPGALLDALCPRQVLSCWPSSPLPVS